MISTPSAPRHAPTRRKIIDPGPEWLQFNRLAGALYTVPRYLFVVTVPRDADKYADLFTKGMLLRNIGYFLSLHDREPLATPDRSRRIRVKIPVANVLTVAALRSLVDREPTGRLPR